MELKRPLVALALAGILAGPVAGCGANSDTDRNEQDCGTAEAAPGQDCEESEDGSVED